MNFSLIEFKEMSFEKKCDVITFQGDYLMQRTLADCKVFLYHAHGFFAEVFYSTQYRKVLMINGFADVEGLDPYLEEISLGILTPGSII